MTRRKFLAIGSGALAAGGLGGYSFWESRAFEVRSTTVRLGGLPSGFEGCRIALISDFHHGWFIPAAFLASAVAATNALQPDLVLLAGDFVDSDPACIPAAMEELGRLRAPLGVYAVQGNRDIAANRVLTGRELARQGIEELTNRGRWLWRNGSQIWLCGLDDSTIGSPDIPAALAGLPGDTPAILVTHNPEVVESLDDPRILLVCCGHTHGGQINLPLLGRLFLFSSACRKYAQGLVQSAHSKVFTTTGVGSFFPPLRFRCPPEIALLTLVRQ